jgi:nucleotide-binding universal stress UspA family protein
MFDQVLLAVDGSGRSREMMNMLLALPSMQRTQVTVLHVIPVSASSEGLTEYRLAGERTVDKETKSLRLSATNSSVSLLKEGDPKDVVCKVADELKPSMLIMGSRGMGRLQAILANSVSQYVFQLASTPMLLVKDDVYIKTIRNIMVVLENSTSSKESLDFAVKLTEGSSDIEIFLTRTFVRSGDPGKEICKAADDGNASLLVIGSPDRRPSIARNLPDLDRLLGTSLSDYVRVNAGCPVLLTRAKEE